MTTTNAGIDVEVTPCPACGANNRVPRAKLAAGLRPVCGRCKAPLRGEGPQIATDVNFASLVGNSPLPVLLDMWAPWCGPCRTVGPIIDQLSIELADRVRVAKLNVDDNPATAMRYNIRGIPTLLLFKGGQVVSQQVGATGKSDIQKMLDAHL
ncbi:MAG: thioredoxin [Bryobacteraceae bacterium]|nr:thioredoxin [Bryobacteraceae bacterium]